MVLRVVLISILLVSIGLATDKESKEVHPVMKKFDKNKDGKLFYTEASEDLQEYFCQYDVNQDGYLDKKEIVAVPKKFAKAKKIEK